MADNHAKGPGLKNPWIAVGLNCFPLVMGLGYIYLGRWVRFVIVFVGVQFLGAGFVILPILTELGLRFLLPYLLGVVWVYTLYDAYARTREHNTRIQAPQVEAHTEPQAEEANDDG